MEFMNFINDSYFDLMYGFGSGATTESPKNTQTFATSVCSKNICELSNASKESYQDAGNFTELESIKSCDLLDCIKSSNGEVNDVYLKLINYHKECAQTERELEMLSNIIDASAKACEEFEVDILKSLSQDRDSGISTFNSTLKPADAFKFDLEAGTYNDSGEDDVINHKQEEKKTPVDIDFSINRDYSCSARPILQPAFSLQNQPSVHAATTTSKTLASKPRTKTAFNTVDSAIRTSCHLNKAVYKPWSSLPLVYNAPKVHYIPSIVQTPVQVSKMRYVSNCYPFATLQPILVPRDSCSGKNIIWEQVPVAGVHSKFLVPKRSMTHFNQKFAPIPESLSSGSMNVSLHSEKAESITKFPFLGTNLQPPRWPTITNAGKSQKQVNRSNSIHWKPQALMTSGNELCQTVVSSTPSKPQTAPPHNIISTSGSTSFPLSIETSPQLNSCPSRSWHLPTVTNTGKSQKQVNRSNSIHWKPQALMTSGNELCQTVVSSTPSKPQTAHPHNIISTSGSMSFPLSIKTSLQLKSCPSRSLTSPSETSTLPLENVAPSSPKFSSQSVVSQPVIATSSLQNATSLPQISTSPSRDTVSGESGGEDVLKLARSTFDKDGSRHNAHLETPKSKASLPKVLTKKMKKKIKCHPPSYLNQGNKRGMIGLVGEEPLTKYQKKQFTPLQNPEFRKSMCDLCRISNTQETCIHIERNRINQPNPGSKHKMRMRERRQSELTDFELASSIITAEMDLNLDIYPSDTELSKYRTSTPVKYGMDENANVVSVKSQQSSATERNIVGTRDQRDEQVNKGKLTQKAPKKKRYDSSSENENNHQVYGKTIVGPSKTRRILKVIQCKEEDILPFKGVDGISSTDGSADERMVKRSKKRRVTPTLTVVKRMNAVIPDSDSMIGSVPSNVHIPVNESLDIVLVNSELVSK